MTCRNCNSETLFTTSLCMECLEKIKVDNKHIWIEEGAIRAYQMLLDLNIGNCETNVWLRTQISLLKKKGGVVNE